MLLFPSMKMFLTSLSRIVKYIKKGITQIGEVINTIQLTINWITRSDLFIFINSLKKVFHS